MVGGILLSEALQSMPTLCVGQSDDLKIETPTLRVWVSRCGVADGACCEGHISVEKLADGRWQKKTDVHGDETLDDDDPS